MPRHSPSRLLVHVVWATRGRRRALPEEFDADLAAIVGSKARATGCLLLAAGIASDHVHVLVQVASTIALADAVQCLKGATAHDINRHARLPAQLLWQAGYWAESLSPADLAPLARYVREQRRHHDDSHPAERWQLGLDGEPAKGGL